MEKVSVRVKRGPNEAELGFSMGAVLGGLFFDEGAFGVGKFAPGLWVEGLSGGKVFGLKFGEVKLPSVVAFPKSEPGVFSRVALSEEEDGWDAFGFGSMKGVVGLIDAESSFFLDGEEFVRSMGPYATSGLESSLVVRDHGEELAELSGGADFDSLNVLEFFERNRGVDNEFEVLGGHFFGGENELLFFG